MWWIKAIAVLGSLYGFVLAAAYLFQTWLIFPASMVGPGPSLPPQARHLMVETGDGTPVALTLLPATNPPASPRPTLIAFGGNAWHPDMVALLLGRIFPEYDVAALHYRGYARIAGRPAPRAIEADARAAFDYLQQQDGTRQVFAVGFSIGTGIAIDLAAHRPVAGALLVTPFDSLAEPAAGHYPWLPVRWLLRHRMEPAATLADLDLPVAVILAERDTVIPPARSAQLVASARSLRASISIEAGHNDLYDRAAFIEAMRTAITALETAE